MLTKCTAVGTAVDLDTIADNHQVGGHLLAFVRLHVDVLSVLVERQLLQVAHPLTCQGKSVTRRLAEGRHIIKAGIPAKADLGKAGKPREWPGHCGPTRQWL